MNLFSLKYIKWIKTEQQNMLGLYVYHTEFGRNRLDSLGANISGRM